MEIGIEIYNSVSVCIYKVDYFFCIEFWWWYIVDSESFFVYCCDYWVFDFEFNYLYVVIKLRWMDRFNKCWK